MIVECVSLYSTISAQGGDKTGSLAGRVSMTQFGWLSSIPVTAVSDTNLHYRTSTDQNGKFSFSDLPVGKYEVVVSLTDIDKMRPVKVVPGIANIDIRLGIACDGFAAKKAVEAEDAQIMRKALLEGLHRMASADSKRLVISTANLPGQLVVEDLGPDIVFFSEDRNLSKDEPFFRVSDLTVRTGCVGITIENVSNKGNMSGEGMTLEYLQNNGKWSGRKVGGWVS